MNVMERGRKGWKGRDGEGGRNVERGRDAEGERRKGWIVLKRGRRYGEVGRV